LASAPIHDRLADPVTRAAEITGGGIPHRSNRSKLAPD